MQATFGGVPETTEASELVPQKLEDADLGFGPSRFGRPKAESSVSLLSSLLSSLPSGRSLVTAFAEARTSEMAPGLQWLCVGCVSNVSKALIGNTCGITRAGGASDSVFVFDIGVQACNRCLLRLDVLLRMKGGQQLCLGLGMRLEEKHLQATSQVH